MPFAVVIHEKGGQPRRQDFDKNEVTIGRVQGNDIVLPKQNVSKKHSRIVVKDGKFIIVDLKSTNGTYVNGRKIASPMVIKETDKIYIGDFILSTEGTGAATSSPVEAAPEPEVPKVEPPRKAPTPPKPAKLVPSPASPSKPVSAPGRASPPSGNATAVSYGSPPASAPLQKPDNPTVPPIATPKAAAAPTALPTAESHLGKLLNHAAAENIPLPASWGPDSESDPDSTNALQKFAEEILGPDADPTLLIAEATGAGPIQPFLGDETVQAIYVDGPGCIQIENENASQKLDEVFSSTDAVILVAQRLLAGCGHFSPSMTDAVAHGKGITVSFVMHGSTPHLCIEKVNNDQQSIGSLVKEGMLTASMAEFLSTALALNRTIVISSNQLEATMGLTESLVESGWQDERVVVLDPGGQFNGLSAYPHLDQSGDINLLCRHAGLLRSTHIVVNGISGTELGRILETSHRLPGGCILTTRANSADAAFENLRSGLALQMNGGIDAATDYLQSSIDAIIHVNVNAAQEITVQNIVDTHGRKAVIFSNSNVSETSDTPPGWLEQAAQDGYEVNLDLFA